MKTIAIILGAALTLFLLNDVLNERNESSYMDRKHNGCWYGVDVAPYGYSNDSLQLFYLTNGEEKQDTSWMACTDFDERENCCESESMEKAIELTFIHSETTNDD